MKWKEEDCGRSSEKVLIKQPEINTEHIEKRIIMHFCTKQTR
jgi:hypothetical protein